MLLTIWSKELVILNVFLIRRMIVMKWGVLVVVILKGMIIYIIIRGVGINQPSFEEKVYEEDCGGQKLDYKCSYPVALSGQRVLVDFLLFLETFVDFGVDLLAV